MPLTSPRCAPAHAAALATSLPWAAGAAAADTLHAFMPEQGGLLDD